MTYVLSFSIHSTLIDTLTQFQQTKKSVLLTMYSEGSIMTYVLTFNTHSTLKDNFSIISTNEECIILNLYSESFIMTYFFTFCTDNTLVDMILFVELQQTITVEETMSDHLLKGSRMLEIFLGHYKNVSYKLYSETFIMTYDLILNTNSFLILFLCSPANNSCCRDLQNSAKYFMYWCFGFWDKI